MSITLLPDPPSRANPSDFANKADLFLGALPTFAVEANTLATDVNLKQTQTAASAVAADLSADAAALSETNAAASAVAADASADAAALSATSAINAPGTTATSTTSLTIGTGSKTFTIQTGKAYSVGQTVVVANTVTPTNQMTGVITDHNSGTGSITVDVQAVSGAGTFASWSVGMSTISGVITVNGQAGHVSNLATLSGTEILSNKTLVDSSVRSTVNVITTSTTAVVGHTYVLAANLVLNLPATLVAGDMFSVQNSSGLVSCVIGRNGHNIMSLAEDLLIDKLNVSFNLTYIDSTRGVVIS